MKNTDAEIFRACRLAIKRVTTKTQANFYDWVNHIGNGYIRAKELALQATGNRDDTKEYRVEFGNILRAEKLHPDNGGIDRATRAKLLEIMENKKDVITWWEQR